MKQSVKLTLFVLITLALAVVPALSQANDAANKRAEELLVKAREAIGGDTKIKAVKSLSLTGKFRRSSEFGNLSGRIEFDFLSPDKFINTEKLELAVGTITVVSGMSGETVWQNTSSSSENITFAGFTQKDINDRKPALRRAAARWILDLLLRTAGWSSLEVAYAGEARDGEARVNLIDVKGTDGFNARLFLDKTTNRLKMMSYTEKASGSNTAKAVQDANGTSSPDKVRVRFADYRAIDGIQLPHRIIIQSGKSDIEERELTEIRLDIPLSPEIFKEKA